MSNGESSAYHDADMVTFNEISYRPLLYETCGKLNNFVENKFSIKMQYQHVIENNLTQ